MNEYTITNNALEIISGTNNTISPIYMEAAYNVERDQKKAAAYIKRFMLSINKVAPRGRLKNIDISQSGGNITSLRRYDEINQSLEILSKHIPSNPELKALKTIKSKLEDNKMYYIDAYRNNIILLVMEYETAAYLLMEGLGFILASYVSIDSIRGEFKIVPKKGSINKGIISKLLLDMAKELDSTNHTSYLKELSNTTGEGVITEAVGDVTAEVLKLISAIVSQTFNIYKKSRYVAQLFIKSIFGIIPLMRSIIYLYYKKKANKINSLELNAQFIQLNIEMLKNKTNMDSEKKAIIIKKQEAKVAAYLKAAEKLRAELVEAEKDTSVALKDDNATINQSSDDDDFILD